MTSLHCTECADSRRLHRYVVRICIEGVMSKKGETGKEFNHLGFKLLDFAGGECLLFLLLPKALGVDKIMN